MSRPGSDQERPRRKSSKNRSKGPTKPAEKRRSSKKKRISNKEKRVSKEDGRRSKPDLIADDPPRPKGNRRRKSAAPEPAPPPSTPRFDVRASFSRLGARLRRPLGLLLRLVIGVAVLAGGFAGYRLIETYARTAPYFEITHVELSGLERLEEDAVLRTAGIGTGENVFARPADEVAERLERHPWIATATVERRLPGTFQIDVVERRAVAVLALGNEAYLVGDEGSLFKKVAADDPVDLPVLTGADVERFLGDRAYRSQCLLDAVTLMHDYRSAGLWRREPIGEIHLEPDDGLSVYVGDDGMFVRLSHGPWRPKLRRLRQILDRLDAQEARAEYVYLDNERRPDRVTVRLRGLPPPPEPPSDEG